MSKNLWNSPWKALGFVIVAGLVLFSIFQFGPTLLKSLTGTTPSTTTTANGPTLSLPMVLVVLDQYTGNGLSTSGSTTTLSVLVIDPVTTITKESLTTTSGGLSVTTALSYTSGTSWTIAFCRPSANCNPLSNSTSNTRYVASVTTPYGQPNQTGQTTHVPLSIYAKAIGTYTVTVLDDSSASITSNAVKSISGSAIKSYTVVLANTADNTGFITFTDPQVKRTMSLDILTKVAGNSTTNPGLTISDWTQWGTGANINGGTVWYGQEPQSGFLDRQKLPDNTYPSNARGSATFSLTINTAGLTTLQVNQVTIRVYAFFSQAYFATNTSLNTETVSSAIFNFYVKRT